MHTSGTEVTNVSSHGLWLLTQGKELFLSFEDFPWFKNASIGDITAVEEVSPGHFYWSELDIDLGIDTIENPDKYPLTASAKSK
ncbi:MAG: DUF2442 domain-containing protein [Pseudomonadales bacterium]